MHRVLSRARSGQVDGRHSWPGFCGQQMGQCLKNDGRGIWEPGLVAPGRVVVSSIDRALVGCETGTPSASHHQHSDSQSTASQPASQPAQHSTVQYSTAQDGTAPHNHGICLNCLHPHRLTSKERCAASRRCSGRRSRHPRCHPAWRVPRWASVSRG